MEHSIAAAEQSIAAVTECLVDIGYVPSQFSVAQDMEVGQKKRLLSKRV